MGIQILCSLYEISVISATCGALVVKYRIIKWCTIWCILSFVESLHHSYFSSERIVIDCVELKWPWCFTPYKLTAYRHWKTRPCALIGLGVNFFHYINVIFFYLSVGVKSMKWIRCCLIKWNLVRKRHFEAGCKAVVLMSQMLFSEEKSISQKILQSHRAGICLYCLTIKLIDVSTCQTLYFRPGLQLFHSFQLLWQLTLSLTI